MTQREALAQIVKSYDHWLISKNPNAWSLVATAIENGRVVLEAL